MSKKIVAVFSSREQAEKAANELRQNGFEQEISVVTKDNNQRNNDQSFMDMGTGDTVTDGAATGATWGALGGLALGAGALAIPGLGPIIAAGPIAAALSGAAAGGLGGALIDMGIPETESRQYEEEVRQGNTLITVECSENKVQKAKQILQNSGANRIKEH
ncbi:MAG: hypothetical protein GXY91_04480 [Clostridia bacterium]|nr:hypothetical protein [Clostridia bacterium]